MFGQLFVNPKKSLGNIGILHFYLIRIYWHFAPCPLGGGNNAHSVFVLHFSDFKFCFHYGVQ